MAKIFKKRDGFDIRPLSSCCGSPISAKQKYKYDENEKSMVAYFDKEYNLYEQIQACKNSCDIQTIISRMKCGDMSVINVNPGVYADVSDVPNNINDLFLIQSKGISMFNSLDPNVRSLFDNDVNKFIKALDDNTYMQTINDYFKSLNSNNGGEGNA